MSFSADEFDLELEAVSGLLEASQLDDADVRARALLKARPSNPLARNLMALIDFARGRFVAAFETFSSLARRNADVVSLRLNAGVAALCAGELDAAHDNLRRAVDLDSGHRRAFAYLAVVHLMGGQRDLARAALLEAGFPDLAGTVGDGPIEPVVSAARALADRIGAGADGAQQPRAWEGFAELGALAHEKPRRANPSSSLAEAVQSVVDGGEAAPSDDDSPEEIAEEIEEDLDEAFTALQMESTGELSIDPSHAAAAAAEFAPDDGDTDVTAPPPVHHADAGGADAAAAAAGDGDDPNGGDNDIEDNVDDAFAELEAGFAPPSPAQTAQASTPAEQTIEAPSEERLAPSPARAIRATSATPGRKPTCFEHLPELSLAANDAAEVDGPTLRLVIEDVPRFDHVYVRQDLLAASRGEVRFDPARARRKGALQEPFVVGEQPIWRVAGAAEHLLVAPREHRFELIHLVDESVYLAERCLAAFSAGLRWENGRIPGAAGEADGIVQLSGRGMVAVHTRGGLSRLAVGDAPVEVRGECLLGWAGDTVPSATSVAATPGPHVECRGAGVLLLCLVGVDISTSARSMAR